ncbi:MAG: Lrp/AsnC ligand binding domain-containing protein [Chloroflexi bacterium]|nr:Lrp/AsnC ligand binding domain-containing protein [Chloroflexota bacterium]
MVAAFVMIQMSVSGGWADARDLHNTLHGVMGVKTVYFLSGPTDILAFVEAADMTSLMDSIGKIRSVKGVASTDTRMVLPI